MSELTKLIGKKSAAEEALKRMGTPALTLYVGMPDGNEPVQAAYALLLDPAANSAQPHPTRIEGWMLEVLAVAGQAIEGMREGVERALLQQIVQDNRDARNAALRIRKDLEAEASQAGLAGGKES